MQRILTNALGEIGCTEILASPDGNHALEQCDETTDLIITGWSQQGNDGIDLAREIRAKEDCAQIPILMVSTRNSKDDVNAAIQAGVNSYILKPFTVETLKLKLEQFACADEDEPAEADTPSPPDSVQEAQSSPDTDSPE